MNSNQDFMGWVCRTHRNIVWDAPGECPLCRAPLARGNIFSKPGDGTTETAPGPDRRSFLKIGFGLASGLLVWFGSRSICRATGIGPVSGMISNARMMGGGCMGGGMMGGMRGSVRVPEKLPTPRNPIWTSNLREILSLERLSLVQYETDEDKFRVYRPYMMIIPQEENHIQWITELFSAYGLSSTGPTPAIRRSETLTQAYETAMELEANLLPRYQWLIENAEDNDTRWVLNPISAQTGMHYRMFGMTLRMSGMMGRGMR